MSNICNRASAYFEFGRQGIQRFIGCSHGFYNLRGNFGIWVLISLQFAVATFGNAILLIICICSEKEMLWPNATRIIAGVKHVYADRNCSEFQFVRKAMGLDWTSIPTMHAKPSVSVPLSTNPIPASMPFANDESPESLRWLDEHKMLRIYAQMIFTGMAQSLSTLERWMMHLPGKDVRWSQPASTVEATRFVSFEGGPNPTRRSFVYVLEKENLLVSLNSHVQMLSF